jgi:hypothetical protein
MTGCNLPGILCVVSVLNYTGTDNPTLMSSHIEALSGQQYHVASLKIELIYHECRSRTYMEYKIKQI